MVTIPEGRDLQLSERLFVLPEYNTATNLFMVATINDLMRRKDAVLTQIKSHDVVDLPKSQITTSSGQLVETDPILWQMEFSIALSDSIAGNLGGLAASLKLRAAVLASAALMAMRRVETSRRSGEKKRQEERVEAALIAGGLTKVPTRVVETGTEAPAAGEFCRESKLGSRKADFIVGLWDHRIMPIECKVSNSFLNSIKRLNNDAAVKAVVWRQDFGERRVVPAAVLSGVYNLRNLIEAQSRGLTLFWAHDLQSLIDWIETSRR